MQIGDENVHRVRALMDEVFGEEISFSQISIRRQAASTSVHSVRTYRDYVLWYRKGQRTRQVSASFTRESSRRT